MKNLEILSPGGLDDYQFRLRCGVAMVEVLADAMYANGYSASHYKEAANGIAAYLTQLCDELYASIQASR